MSLETRILAAVQAIALDIKSLLKKLTVTNTVDATQISSAQATPATGGLSVSLLDAGSQQYLQLVDPTKIPTGGLKTINNQSIEGTGNLVIAGGSGSTALVDDVSDPISTGTFIRSSETLNFNIGGTPYVVKDPTKIPLGGLKTINSQSIEGAGNLTIVPPDEDSVFRPVDFSAPHGFTWISNGDNSNADVGAISYAVGTTATSEDPGTLDTIFSTFPVLVQTTGNTTFTSAGVFNPNHMMKVGNASFGGIIFECLAGFTPVTGGQFFMGIQTGGLAYSDSPGNADGAIGIGGFGGDTLSTGFRLYFGNGTTFDSSVWVDRPAGVRNDPIYKVYIRIAGGANTAKIWVIDYGIQGSPDGIPVLNGQVIDISTLPKSMLMEATMIYGTGSTTIGRTFRSAYMRMRHFNTNPVYPEAATNISGNSATTDVLNTLNGLPQSGATLDQVISWNGSTWVPSTPAAGGGSSDPLTLNSTDETAPAIGNVKIFRKIMGGRQMLGFVGPSGMSSALQPHIARNKISVIIPTGNATTITTLGSAAPTATGTATASNVAVTNTHTRMTRVDYLVTTAAATAVAGWRSTAAQYTVGGAQTWNGGFHYNCRFGPATGTAVATNRCFVGLGNSVAAPTDVQPSTITNIVGVGWDSADTNIQIMYRGTGAIVKIDTTIPVPTVDRTSVFELTMFSPPGLTQVVHFDFRDIVNDITVSSSITTNLPTNATLLAPRGWMSVGGTSSVIGIALMSQYVETDL